MPRYDKRSHHHSEKGLQIKARIAKPSLPDLADSAIFQIAGLWMLLAGLFGIYFGVILKYLYLCLTCPVQRASNKMVYKQVKPGFTNYQPQVVNQKI